LVITTGLKLEVVMGRRRLKKSDAASDAGGAQKIVSTSYAGGA
jgi:hypothetical protein